MIDTLNIFKLLTSWQHGEELDDAVFRVAATLPLWELKHQSYMIPGDERFGFDPNVFVQQLIDETGISHVWEPVATKVREGERLWVSMSVNVPTPERDGKRQARQLVWDIWKRFAPSLDPVLAHRHKEHASTLVARLFADFLMDNIDLVRQLESSFSSGKGPGGMDVLEELERKAQGSI